MRLVLFFNLVSVNKSHKKTKANSALAHLSIFSELPSLSVALSPCLGPVHLT